MMCKRHSALGTLAVLSQCPPVGTTVVIALLLLLGAHLRPWDYYPLLPVDFRI